jgi:hypothetical protein
MPTVPVGRIRDAMTLNFGNIVALGVLRLPTDFGPEPCSRSHTCAPCPLAHSEGLCQVQPSELFVPARVGGHPRVSESGHHARQRGVTGSQIDSAAARRHHVVLAKGGQTCQVQPSELCMPPHPEVPKLGIPSHHICALHIPCIGPKLSCRRPAGPRRHRP